MPGRSRSARGEAAPDGFDGYAFTVAFKSVFLEGLEIAFIVLTLARAMARSRSPRPGPRPSSWLSWRRGVRFARRFACAGEPARVRGRGDADLVWRLLGRRGRRVDWPGGDAALPVLVGVVAAWALVFVAVLKRRQAIAVVQDVVG